jgi:hypothetical protein
MQGPGFFGSTAASKGNQMKSQYLLPQVQVEASAQVSPSPQSSSLKHCPGAGGAAQCPRWHTSPVAQSVSSLQQMGGLHACSHSLADPKTASQ